mmetsp:Transcript_19938/g.45998  ORF Transcript_19938/g.45998 Transcript_19938/m.45998 type:complete len:154 (-) Transcript_19938:60-521(-)
MIGWLCVRHCQVVGTAVMELTGSGGAHRCSYFSQAVGRLSGMVSSTKRERSHAAYFIHAAGWATHMRSITSAEECFNGGAAAIRLRRIECRSPERRDARGAGDLADRAEARRDCGVGGWAVFRAVQNFAEHAGAVSRRAMSTATWSLATQRHE